MVDFKAPEHVEQYDQYPVDGFTVYIKKNVNIAAPTLKVKVEKFFFIKNLTVEGLEIKA